MSLSQSLLGTMTFINLKLEEESAIFSRLKVNFSPSHPIDQLVVSNNHLALIMRNKILIRINLQHPNNLEEIDLSKFSSHSKICKMFIDPTGQHMLISFMGDDEKGDLMYLPWKSNKLKICNKLRGSVVTAIAWNPRNRSESTTGPILLGTSKGIVYEMDMTSDERLFQSGHEQYCRQVYDLSYGCPILITGLEIFVLPNDETGFLIFCSTPDKLFQFSGYAKQLDDSPLFSSIFASYLGPPANTIEFSSSWDYSWLKLFYGSNRAIHFAWMCKQGVYIAEINWSSGIQDNMFQNGKLHRFYECDDKIAPQDFIITEFHVLIVWQDKISGICYLNDHVVVEDCVPEDCGRLVGVTKDTLRGTIWVYAETGIFKYKVDREGRNVWKIYLEQKNYELARKCCQNNSEFLAIISLQEADDLFNKGDYINSAHLFAKSHCSFEECCLKFMTAGQEEALEVFLLEKLDALKYNEETQISIIVMWLLELQLKHLGSLRDLDKVNTHEYNEVDKNFKLFCEKPKVLRCIKLNSIAVYDLISSHSDHNNYVYIAFLLMEHEKVLHHLLSHNRYLEALEVLNKQSSEQLFYQHISALLQAIPKDTVDVLISQGTRLSPIKLLPALVQIHISCGYSSHILRYLEHCINNLDCTEKVIHNFLVSLYASHCTNKLLPYLNLQGDDISSVGYDVKFALKECLSENQDKASIHILTLMGLYQEAVELALKTDISIAKVTANKPKFDSDLRKKLWLTIAAHVVQEKQEIDKAMEVLKECDLIKIEDILPFFPDFVKIDQFKEAICSSLQNYNSHIEELKEEMQEASKAAESIKKDIQKYRQSYAYIHPEDKCCECSYPLLTRAFYLFPCSHKFHQDCLLDTIVNYLPEKEFSKLKDLLSKLQSFASDDVSAFKEKREELKSKIDEIVAKECLYCGELFLSIIDKPFISNEDWDAVMQEWL